MKYLKIRFILTLIIIGLFCQIVLDTFGYKPWGEQTKDGSEIQIYWESKVQEKDFRIPQDLQLLETDEFKIWIRSVYYPYSPDNVTIQLFDYHIQEISYFDPKINATRSRQEKVFDIFKDEILLPVEAGDSPYEWHDFRFGIISVNRETFPAFTNVNRTERVRVIFHERMFEFDHWTNIAEVEVTKTYGQFNSELTFWLGIGILILFIFIFFAGLIHRRAGISPPPPSWYFWPMILMFAVGMILLGFLLTGLPIESFGRFMSVLPPVWIAIVAGIWLDFELPKRFSGKVEPYVFLEIDGNQTQTLVGVWALWGYFKGNKLEFIKNRNSYLEFGKRLLKGGYPSPDWIFKPKVPITSKNKELPRVFGVKSFSSSPSKFEWTFKWYHLLISLVLLPILAIIPLFVGVASLGTGIASFFVLVIAGVYFVITSIRLTSPRLDAEQIIHPSEVQVLTNVHAVEAMQVFVNEVLDEHIDFVKNSEKNVLKRIKSSVKRFWDAYIGKTGGGVKDQIEKEKQKKLERLNELKEVLDWTESKGLLKELENKKETAKT